MPLITCSALDPDSQIRRDRRSTVNARDDMPVGATIENALGETIGERRDRFSA
jgi:hypothetical protein